MCRSLHRFVGQLAARRCSVSKLLLALFAEEECALVLDHEVQVAEVCSALRTFEVDGVEAVTTIVLLVASCKVVYQRSSINDSLIVLEVLLIDFG